jgi:hypothetical protein
MSAMQTSEERSDLPDPDPWARFGGQEIPPPPTGLKRVSPAKVGIVLGSVAAVVLVVVGLVSISREAPDRGTTGAVKYGGPVLLEHLRAGDCVRDVGTEDSTTLEVVACGTPHAGEVFAVASLAFPSFPGDAELIRFADGRCASSLDTWTGVSPHEDSGYDVSFFYPSASSWADGDRRLICLLEDPAGNPLNASTKGAGALRT